MHSDGERYVSLLDAELHGLPRGHGEVVGVVAQAANACRGGWCVWHLGYGIRLRISLHNQDPDIGSAPWGARLHAGLDPHAQRTDTLADGRGAERGAHLRWREQRTSIGGGCSVGRLRTAYRENKKCPQNYCYFRFPIHIVILLEIGRSFPTAAHRRLRSQARHSFARAFSARAFSFALICSGGKPYTRTLNAKFPFLTLRPVPNPGVVM